MQIRTEESDSDGDCVSKPLSRAKFSRHARSILTPHALNSSATASATPSQERVRERAQGVRGDGNSKMAQNRKTNESGHFFVEDST